MADLQEEEEGEEEEEEEEEEEHPALGLAWAGGSAVEEHQERVGRDGRR
jgi:hypothetical protein